MLLQQLGLPQAACHGLALQKICHAEDVPIELQVETNVVYSACAVYGLYSTVTKAGAELPGSSG